MSSDLRYLDSSMLSEDSTLLSYQPELTRKLVPRLGLHTSKHSSSSLLQGKRPPRIPPLRTKALNSRVREKSERVHDDFFFLNEYRKTEIPLSRKTFNTKCPFWFQDLSADESVQRKKLTITEYTSIEDTKVNEFSANDHKLWFRSMLALCPNLNSS